MMENKRAFEAKEYFEFELSDVAHKTISGEMKLEPSFILLKEIPRFLETRYGKLPKRLMIRPCYRELYDISVTSMLRKNREGEYDVTLFTGVPGIGKSMFLLYFLYRFLNDDRFEDKRFALEIGARGKYFVFYPSNVPGEFRVLEQTSLPTDILLLCDLSTKEEPGSRAKWTFIFSSPDPSLYKEIMKNQPKFKYRLPTWSEGELSILDSDKASWIDRFDIFGGVPRHLFFKEEYGKKDSSMLELEEALENKGGALAESFFKFGYGTVDNLINYMLVHVNPPVRDNGIIDYAGKREFSFASDFIFRKLVEKYNSQLLAQAIGIFNSGSASYTFGAGSAGHLFEKICLWLEPLTGKQIEATMLDKSGLNNSVNLTIPSFSQILPHDWKVKGGLSAGQHYLPHVSNLESADCFYAACNNEALGTYTLVNVQITVSENHPVKANGLVEIYEAYSCNITEVVVLFLVPVHCNLNCVQKLKTKEDSDLKRIPKILSELKQYVYRYRI